MAKNQIFASGRQLTVAVASGTASGDPVLVGTMTGVALEDRDSNGNAPVAFDGVYDLSVKAIDDAGNSAVALGDHIYLVNADTPKLSKKASGNFFGFALEAITGGSTDTIRVLNIPGPGPGTADILAGAIGTSELAANAVETAKIKDANVTTDKLAAEAVTAEKALVFVSAEQTADGNPQDIAHGLGAVPTHVLVVPTELPDAAAETGFDIAEGAHDATNVKVTATATLKYKVMAWA